ncbi:MAG: hypothetical protein MZV70_68045 [Desulfobacterales bacterium]|nr:hypothetical protein [Desulfobacterales bacterium]
MALIHAFLHRDDAGQPGRLAACPSPCSAPASRASWASAWGRPRERLLPRRPDRAAIHAARRRRSWAMSRYSAPSSTRISSPAASTSSIPLAWFYLYRTRNGLCAARRRRESPHRPTRWASTSSEPSTLLHDRRRHARRPSAAPTCPSPTRPAGRRTSPAAVAGSSSPWSSSPCGTPRGPSPGALLFGGINAVQFRLQASGHEHSGRLPQHAAVPDATIAVLVAITWWETLSKRVGSPASLGTAYVREDK